MGAFGGLQITNKGRALQAKGQAGAQLRFTRIAIGDGTLSSQLISDLNALIGEKKSLAISKLKAQTGGKAVVGGILSNTDISVGFYFREIGVFAQDPDIGEILYCYGNAGANAEYIPAGGGPDIVEKHIDIVTIVGSAANVSANIDTSLVFVTMQELLDHKNSVVLDHPDSSVTNAKLAPDSVTADKIAAGAVGNSELASNAVTADKIQDGAITDAEIGNRTIDQSTATAYGNTGTITQLFSWLGKVIKALTGKTNWYDAPDITLAATNTHVNTNTIGVHGSTSAATANRLIHRDANGRAKVAAPSASDDIARKDTVDAVQTNLTNHTNATDPHPQYQLKGGANTDVNKTKAVTLQTDTRTLVLTYTGNQLTKVEEKDGATAVKTTSLSYNGDGTLGTVTEVAGGTTVTKTLNYTTGNLSSVTKVVV